MAATPHHQHNDSLPTPLTLMTAYAYLFKPLCINITEAMLHETASPTDGISEQGATPCGGAILATSGLVTCEACVGHDIQTARAQDSRDVSTTTVVGESFAPIGDEAAA